MKVRGIAVAALSCVAAAANAQEGNFRPYVLGDRAAGMGGAFTALADEGSGSYYNPGGMAFSKRSSLSLSGSVYGLIQSTTTNALGQGHDFTATDFNTFPVSTCAVRKLGEADPETGAAPHTLVFSVFVPDALQQDDRDNLGLQQSAYFSAENREVLWVGATYAYRAGRWGFGASFFGIMGTDTQSIDVSAVSATSSADFGIISARVDQTTYGGVLAGGVRFDATPHLHLGLSVFSPEIGWGSRRFFVRAAAGDINGQPAQGVIQTVDNLSAGPVLPLRAQFGIAYELGPWTFAADAMLLAPRSVTSTTVGAENVVLNAVVNGSVGVERVFADAFPVRAGLFTDFSASPSPVRTDIDNGTHVDRYGATLSVGYQTEHTRTDVGLCASYGTGQTVIPQNLDFNTEVATPIQEILGYVFLATSYEF